MELIVEPMIKWVCKGSDHTVLSKCSQWSGATEAKPCYCTYRAATGECLNGHILDEAVKDKKFYVQEK